MMLIDALEARRLLAATYSLTILPPASGSSASHAMAINDSGQVVGFSDGGKTQAMIWKGSTSTILPADPGGESDPFDINNNGDVLYKAYYRKADGTFTKLEFSTVSFATPKVSRFNGKDVSVGQFLGLAGYWQADGSGFWLNEFGDSSNAYDINDDGVIVGSSTSSDGTIPFIYVNKQMKPLTIPASANPFAEATTINSAGDVAGVLQINSGGTTVKHAVVWVNSLMESLPKLNGSDFSLATQINDNDDVVGYGNVPFLYHNGVMSDLNSLVNLPNGTKLTKALGINNKGQIVGEASTPNGTRGFVMQVMGTATISGTVFNDANVNTAKDSGETSISAAKVYVDANKNGVLDTGEITAITDSSGNYKFGSLASGTYRIRQASVSGYRMTTPAQGYFDVTVTSGQNVTGKNFGNTQKVLITGTVWKDANGNGVKDSGDGGFSGVKVFIDKNKNGALDSGESSTTTDSVGNYSFKTLAAGSYRVREVVPASWRQTAPSSGFYDLTLGSGAIAAGKNFGDTQSILISGNVFNDLDHDGVKDSTEKGLNGWRVFIDLDKDGVWDSNENSMLTDSSGNFSFKSLKAGTYVLRVVRPDGWTRTLPSAGSYTITLSAAGIASGKNFGFFKNPTV